MQMNAYIKKQNEKQTNKNWTQTQARRHQLSYFHMQPQITFTVT